uniref:Uncharacterized protein n=1 Tax=Cacopsylla melanoneura TaxID=428564 RepID=A0A8D9B283_9HEMI
MMPCTDCFTNVYYLCIVSFIHISSTSELTVLLTSSFSSSSFSSFSSFSSSSSSVILLFLVFLILILLCVFSSSSSLSSNSASSTFYCVLISIFIIIFVNFHIYKSNILLGSPQRKELSPFYNNFIKPFVQDPPCVTVKGISSPFIH